ncbi:MAG: hypothetical protein M0Z55_10055 [Peptococcaceae bacterium]|nr:hypothetical protein [Peptococcaceae bacterium]
MDVWAQVQDLPPQEKGFQVFHRRLKVPQEVFRKLTADFPQPQQEEGFQDFVARYLQAKRDCGVVGMVRVEEEDGAFVLDAAVRYPVEPNSDQDDAYFWSS